MKDFLGVHQWLPGFTSGDAISNDAIVLQEVIREKGYKSEIFCPSRHVSPKVRNLCHDIDSYREYSNPNNIVIYHFSIGSPLSEGYQAIPDKKIIIYHNITPDHYFRSINAEKALVLYQGRRELQTLCNVSALALADSEYNRIELEEWGYKNTKVLPPFIDFEGLAKKPDQKTLNRYDDDWTNLIFVGRITPNKKIEDVIKVFYYYKNTINPKSRLFIVGSFVGMEKYCSYLRALTLELNLQNVILTGHVTTEELVAYYKLSDVFVCMSEHEGFCIPLVESMYYGVPIIAFSAAAIPYTLNGTGVLVTKKDFQYIAELIDLINTNTDMKKEIIGKQNVRLNDFSKEKITEDFYSILYNFNFS
jgi:glycosyltransferase involved in cell wall biosynthesis